MSHHVAILAYDQLCTFEFGCAIEFFALERPELGVPWYTYVVCAAEAGPLQAMGGLTVHAPGNLQGLECADTIVIPGWRDIEEAPPAEVLAALNLAARRGARLCSICSGAFVLAHAGLLEGKKATTHWRHADALARRFPSIDVDHAALYVQDGHIMTSAGSAAGLDMLLHLVRTDFGSEVANLVAQRLVIPAHRDGDQAQRVARPLPAKGDNKIARLMDWVRENLRFDHSVESMAGFAQMGKRTLHRKFKEVTGSSPLEWLVRERVALAATLLESRPLLDVETVADLAGFGSSASLRRHFREHGLPPPAQHRRKKPPPMAMPAA